MGRGNGWVFALFGQCCWKMVVAQQTQAFYYTLYLLCGLRKYKSTTWTFARVYPVEPRRIILGETAALYVVTPYWWGLLNFVYYGRWEYNISHVDYNIHSVCRNNICAVPRQTLRNQQYRPRVFAEVRKASRRCVCCVMAGMSGVECPNGITAL